MHQVIIAFGANLGDRHKTFRIARTQIAEKIGKISKVSGLYDTEPLVLPGEDPHSQPRYLNAVLVVESDLEPEAVLDCLLQIELNLGRKRNEFTTKWKPRTIDLDLIAIDQEQHSSPKLSLPHPEMHKRTFVLEPLCEICPDWVHPGLGKSALELLSELRSAPLACANFE